MSWDIRRLPRQPVSSAWTSSNNSSSVLDFSWFWLFALNTDQRPYVPLMAWNTTLVPVSASPRRCSLLHGDLPAEGVGRSPAKWNTSATPEPIDVPAHCDTDGARTTPGTLDWITLTRYALCYRDRLTLLLTLLWVTALIIQHYRWQLTLKVLVTTIDAQWEGMGDVGSARYELALLPPCPTIRVLSYSN